MTDPDPTTRWKPKRPWGLGTLAVAAGAAALLSLSFYHQGLDQSIADLPGVISRGRDFLRRAWPPRLESAQPVERMIQLGRMRNPASPDAGDASRLDPNHLPLFSRIENRPVNRGQAGSPTAPQYVQRFGYAQHSLVLMLTTIEMAIWGTLIAATISLPLGLLGARTVSRGWVQVWLARGLASLSRATPELVLALVLALMYGFGATAGILALGLHSAGFLGKFLADDIENVDRGPQEALLATGAGRLKVVRMAVVPQVLPQYLAYFQYILERNVRTASVLGIVGVGGIGLELKFAYDNGEFDKVCTILIIIFATVLLLECATQWLRRRLIR